MLRLRATLVALLLIAASSLFGAQSLSDCFRKCPPGANACTERCIDEDVKANAEKYACTDRCREAKRDCDDTCRDKNRVVASECQQKCAGNRDCIDQCRGKQAQGCTTTRTRKDTVFEACETAYKNCFGKCNGTADRSRDRDRDRDRDADQHKCTFSCQRWNPRSQACVGPERNDCH